MLQERNTNIQDLRTENFFVDVPDKLIKNATHVSIVNFGPFQVYNNIEFNYMNL